MKKPSCCHHAPSRSPARLAGLLLPALTFLVIPKCPLCLAGWITLLTGLSVTTATAGNLRVGIVVVSVVVPVLLLLLHHMKNPRSMRP